jgi:alpha-L-fucosidase 2
MKTMAVISPGLFLKSIPFKEFILSAGIEKPNETIWFKNPGKYWNSQSMHIGNGFLGLTFLGGVQQESFSITDKTLWTGGPGEYKEYNYGIKPGGKDYLPAIRNLITTNQVDSLKEADKTVREHFVGDDKGYGHFSAFGKLYLNFPHDHYKNYIRKLDLSTAVADIQYDVDGVTYKREYFCSYPDKLAAFKFSSSSKNKLSFTLKWDSFQQEHQVSFVDNVFQLSGLVNGNNRKFCVKMQINCEGGKAYLKGDELIIENADTVTINTAAATEYMPVAPHYNGADPYQLTTDVIKAAGTYDQLKQRHIKDYRGLYDRVSLKVKPDNTAELLPSNERRKKYTGQNTDRGLKVLYFNLSRYLLISSSRPGSLPANLQGGWNMFEAAQWAGNYQSNINVQLNYNGACAANLAECQVPYLDWIKGLVKPGTAVAKAYYNTEGWVSHSIGNIWGYAAPGFEIEWGMYPAAAAWHCHFIWKHFLYTQDKNYLQTSAYPIMKGAALFWLQNLVEYKGHLITAPSGSAEHGAYIKDGKLFATGSSFDQDVIDVPCNFQDIEMVYELFSNTIKAGEILNTDPKFIADIKTARSKLMPLKIGQYGQLQEWEDDIDTPECNHRHIGHLYALWPGTQINTETTALAAAAKKTLDMRGDERNDKNIPHKDIHTGGNWSLGLRSICWTRLRDAERANKIFTKIITDTGFDNMLTFLHVPMKQKEIKDIETVSTPDGNYNLVWQVDTSLAMSGLIADMLLTTNEEGLITLLPALPSEWPEGKISGLRAEGGFTVNIEWKNGMVTKYKVVADTPKKVEVVVNGKNVILQS